jgi:hypothetical protein
MKTISRIICISIGLLCLISIFTMPLTVIADGTENSIEIHAQDYIRDISSITFPQGNPGSIISAPYNNIDGGSSPQTYGTSSKPVVTLVNTSLNPLVIWIKVTAFTPNAVVETEYYRTNAIDIDCGSADNVDNDLVFGVSENSTVTINGSGDGDLAKKDLYLKVKLSSTLYGKSGSSTLEILGEIP